MLISTFPIMSQWKVAIVTRVSYPTGTKKKKKRKNTIIRPPLPIDAICEIWKESASRLQRRCHFNKLTDDRRGTTTDNGCLPIL